MAFDLFYHYFPEIAGKETRELTITADNDILSGSYSLMEMFCINPDCDCRKVILNIVSQKENKVVSIINYGWENEEFYKATCEVDEESVYKYLSPLTFVPESEQKRYSSELSNAVMNYVLKDPSYIQRIKQHYSIFKEKMKNLKNALN